MSKRKPSSTNRGRDGQSDAPRRRSQGRGRAAGQRGNSGGRYWIYGHHAVIAALANPERRLGELRVTPGFKEAHADLVGIADAIMVNRSDLDALLPENAVHQGIAVQAAPLPDLDITDVLGGVAPAAGDCIAVLDQATDPRNVGAVLRSAAAFGLRCVIIQDRNAPPETGAMAKAASGALEHVPLVRVTNLARELEALKTLGFWCVGLDGGADATLAEIRLDGPTAFVFGAEGKGLRRLTGETCDILARIPLSAKVESLNLANAVSITLYEWAR